MKSYDTTGHTHNLKKYSFSVRLKCNFTKCENLCCPVFLDPTELITGLFNNGRKIKIGTNFIEFEFVDERWQR